jgi:hypothetical protein
LGLSQPTYVQLNYADLSLANLTPKIVVLLNRHPFSMIQKWTFR